MDDQSAHKSLRDVVAHLETMLANAAASLPGNSTQEQRDAIVQLVLQRLPEHLITEAAKHTGRSDSEVRTQLLHLAMELNARKRP